MSFCKRSPNNDDRFPSMDGRRAYELRNFYWLHFCWPRSSSKRNAQWPRNQPRWLTMIGWWREMKDLSTDRTRNLWPQKRKKNVFFFHSPLGCLSVGLIRSDGRIYGRTILDIVDHIVDPLISSSSSWSTRRRRFADDFLGADEPILATATTTTEATSRGRFFLLLFTFSTDDVFMAFLVLFFSWKRQNEGLNNEKKKRWERRQVSAILPVDRRRRRSIVDGAGSGWRRRRSERNERQRKKNPKKNEKKTKKRRKTRRMKRKKRTRLIGPLKPRCVTFLMTCRRHSTTSSRGASVRGSFVDDVDFYRPSRWRFDALFHHGRHRRRGWMAVS